MLEDVASDVRNNYYDPTLHGVDWEARVKDAREKIATATAGRSLVLEIAAVLETLNDSHTVFVPPGDPIQQDYGWRFQMIGNHCYVTRVRPKSDAETKGLRPGDEVLTMSGFAPTRDSLNKMKYVFNVLLPQPFLRVDLRDHSGIIRSADVMAMARQARTITDLAELTGRDSWRLRLEYENLHHLRRPQYRDFGQELMVVKLPMFAGTDFDVTRIIEKARDHNWLVLDLRDNPGGAASALQDLLGVFFENDTKIADRVMRESTDTLRTKGSHGNAFRGKLVVLVDSGSASAAELFARVIQIEKRGFILGDRTAGSVMEAKFYSHQTGSNPVFFYGTSVSFADLRMLDGKSIEHIGVTPDETALPTAADLENGRDPVMARAAAMAGVRLSAEEAGKLFTYEWPMN